MTSTRVHGDGEDLREELAGLVARTEPPFVRSDPEAVHAAVRGGRRRVGRTRAAGGLAAVAAVLAVGGVATIAQDPEVREAAPPAAAAPASPKPPPSSAPAAAKVTRGELLKLVRAVAAPAGGTVRARPAGAGDPGITAAVVVETGGGAFEVTAQVLDDRQSVADWVVQDCRSGVDIADEKPCTVLHVEATLAVSASTYTAFPGREQLSLVADTAGGSRLTVVIANYTYTRPDQLKKVGPAWSAVGITFDSLMKAVRQSGLLATTGSTR